MAPLCAVAATLFAVREAAGWHERRVHLADLRSECQTADQRLSEAFLRGGSLHEATDRRLWGVMRRFLTGPTTGLRVATLVLRDRSLSKCQ